MNRYAVTIRRVLYTDVLVEAYSTHDARQRVLEYGPDLAAADFQHCDETVVPATVIRVRAFRQKPVNT
jgi:hypothetical protein